MNMTPEEYNELTKQSSPRSPFIKDFLLAFTIGGLICALGQAIMMAYQSSGMTEEVSGSVTSVTLVLLSIILTGFNIRLCRSPALQTLWPRRRWNSKAKVWCLVWRQKCL